MGRLAAHDLVTEACDVAVRDGRRLGEVLADSPRVTEHITPGRIDALLDPETYLGSAPEFVDRALQAHQSLKH
jgi:3-carboxy-cis,cis-muconate cycloisomerase